jgi:spore maturation protein CgeB
LSRILIVDTYYPDFLNSLPFDPTSTYQLELSKVLGRVFGTSDFYSRNLRTYGWEAIDVIANHTQLQNLWAKENNVKGGVLFAQIEQYQPDVVFMQDLSLLSPGLLSELKEKYVLAGQCSCPMPKAENVEQFDVIFTSFPHYVDIFKSMGVKAVYNPLAYESSLTCEEYSAGRVHDCVFIGGVGAPSHWAYGMKVLNIVAEQIATFKWWGYGASLLPAGPLKDKWTNEAWGLSMYWILAHSKIAISRHGEVAGRFANAMRLFETTGMGALLVTEGKDNLGDFFSKDECVTYESPDDAVHKIRYYLEHDEERKRIAANGQARTLKDHTYKQRMKTVSDTLMEMLD